MHPAREEAVFSSSEDRIRASKAEVSVARSPIVPPTLIASQWMRRVAASLFSVLFPSDCRICGEPLLNVSRLPVCPDCLHAIHPVHGTICDICGERVLSSFAAVDDDGMLRCPICRRIDRPFERAMAYGSYEGGLRELIHMLKYNGVRPAGKVLGRMLADVLARMEPSFEPRIEQDKILLIPVPLYKSKRRQRSFNQSELIVIEALKQMRSERFELNTAALLRIRETTSQIGLTAHQRRENLRGAFEVPVRSQVTGREVVVVDDVYTTGTTVTECARVLRRAGARRVWVATVARTLKLASKYVEDEAESAEQSVMAPAAGS